MWMNCFIFGQPGCQLWAAAVEKNGNDEKHSAKKMCWLPQNNRVYYWEQGWPRHVFVLERIEEAIMSSFSVKRWFLSPPSTTLTSMIRWNSKNLAWERIWMVLWTSARLFLSKTYNRTEMIFMPSKLYSDLTNDGKGQGAGRYHHLGSTGALVVLRFIPRLIAPNTSSRKLGMGVSTTKAYRRLW